MSEKLKPCPFCGRDASPNGRTSYHEEHEAWWQDGTRILESFYVNCMSCGCSNKGLLGHQTKEGAIEHWNTRQPIPLHPTVEQWEEATGEKLKDDDAVWILFEVTHNKKHRGWVWELCEYGDHALATQNIRVVAIPGQGKPKADWRPE